jgi:Domain of unknown function (DUF4440)
MTAMATDRRAPWAPALAVLVFSACAGSRNRPGSQPVPSQSAVEAELRHDTQALLDAIAPGDTAVWNRLLDPAVIQVDENDVVRRKPEILAAIAPLPPGLVGHLRIDDFTVVVQGNAAVVTHEDDEYLDYHGQIIRSRFRSTDTWIDGPTGWREIASQTLAVQQDPPSIRLDRATLCAYAGRYAMTDTIIATIRCAGDSLIVRREGRPDRAFLPEARDVFFERSQPRTRRIFQYDAQGQVRGFVDRREERDIVWKRVEPAD